MSPSSEDPITLVVIHEPRPHLSKHVFNSKCRALADAIMALPVCQMNFLKYDYIFQTSSLDANLGSFGFPESRPRVLTIKKCETPEHWEEVRRNPEFKRLIGEKWGSCHTFFANVVKQVNTPATGDSVFIFSILKAPARHSPEEFSSRLKEIVDRGVALPISQKIYVKHLILFPSNIDLDLQNANHMLRALGLSAFGRPRRRSQCKQTAVTHFTPYSQFACAQSREDFVELLDDPALKQWGREAMPQVEYHVSGVSFLAGVDSRV
ncbi:hypothetical protein B0H16DRAFT_1879650 [Mycena metata]|uniref:Uncharacterized protein n=1 Tax=Mycena metata TaxID=1033252 RepID=A0AAD7NV21_9AGAR|nr:hypothetical protein B0H16DRAFT_1879650 [Mycena metata]